MTTATVVAGNLTMETVGRPRRSLEELVDQLMAAIFKEEEPETAAPAQSVSRSVHEARRLQAGGGRRRGAGGLRRHGHDEG